MATAHVTPEYLELAVPIELVVHFYTSAPEASVAAILAKVKELTLTDVLYHTQYVDPSSSRVSLTAARFPKPRSLKIGCFRRPWPVQEMSEGTYASLITSLVSIYVLRGFPEDPAIMALLDKSRSTLRVVTLRMMHSGCFGEILTLLKTLDFDVLTIDTAYDQDSFYNLWKEDREGYDESGYRGVPQLFWNGIAKRLVLGKQEFDMEGGLKAIEKDGIMRDVE